MLRPSTSSPPDPDPPQQQNPHAALLNNASPAAPIGFGQVADDLLAFSIGQGLWNGLRIGAVYGVVLGLTVVISGLRSGLSHIIGFPYFLPWLQHVFQSLLIGSLAGTVAGVFIGIFFGLLCGTATAVVSRFGFYPIRSWVGYRVWIGLLNMLLVIGTVVALAMLFPLVRELFTIYEPGRYTRHTFSRFEYIFITFGIGYGTVLITSIYSWFHAGILAHRYVRTVGLPQRDRLFRPDTDLYDRSFQEHAFGALANTSSSTTRIVSLGQDNTLRARLVERMHLAPGMAVCDLMTGGGEMWPHLVPLIGRGGSITAVDFTPKMLAHAQKRLNGLSSRPAITLHQADACATGLPDGHFDAVVCAFGLATLTPTLFDNLLQEILRILRPGGIFGFVELSRPAGARRRRWFDSYLMSVAPSLSELRGAELGASLLLREYLTRFDSGQLLLPSFYKQGCVFYRYEFFGGCATAIVGMKDSD